MLPSDVRAQTFPALPRVRLCAPLRPVSSYAPTSVNPRATLPSEVMNHNAPAYEEAIYDAAMSTGQCAHGVGADVPKATLEGGLADKIFDVCSFPFVVMF